MKQQLHTPWSDVAELVSFNLIKDPQGFEYLTPTTDEQGREQPGQPTKRQICCTFEEGTSQKEFYYSHKEGLRASASLELWTVDYQGEEFVDFAGRHFRVLRSFVSGFDMTTLILSEVIR